MAAELADQVGMALGHEVPRVAQVHVGNRTARAADFVVARRRESQRGAPEFLFQAGGDQAHHARVPVGIEQAGRHRPLSIHVQHHAGQRLLGVVGHRLLHRAPFRIDLLKCLRDVACLPWVLGQQQRDAQRHVFQPARSVQARPKCEADVGGGQPCGIAATGFDQGAQADTALPGTQPAQARTDQRTIVRVQRHQVGDGAHRHQVQQRGQVRPLAIGEDTGLAHLPAQRHQNASPSRFGSTMTSAGGSCGPGR
ncbi:hypothetical protein G6F57_017957 [Rhizopus arrhizus]|nr:hypothetical protein G6F57_017957 [Rhizopus arrhizus]